LCYKGNNFLASAENDQPASHLKKEGDNDSDYRSRTRYPPIVPDYVFIKGVHGIERRPLESRGGKFSVPPTSSKIDFKKNPGSILRRFLN
jgi:hypothetical protein